MKYSKGKISIPNVTGNIVISITAVQQGPAYTNLADPSSPDWLANKRISSSGTISNSTNGSQVTNLIPVTAGNVLRIKNAGSVANMIFAAFPNAESTTGSIIAGTKKDIASIATFTVSTADYGYCRILLPGDQFTDVNDIIITVNENIT